MMLMRTCIVLDGKMDIDVMDMFDYDEFSSICEEF